MTRMTRKGEVCRAWCLVGAFFLALWLLGSLAIGQEPQVYLKWNAERYTRTRSIRQEADVRENSPPATMDLPRHVRDYYRNPDGSCVQCSNGMIGWHWRDENLATLLWSTPHGPAIRGGSSPSRVASYCRSRGIAIYNVTGEQKCRAMMEWAAKTNRFAAIGFKSRHFCTLYGREPESSKPWAVCDNNIRSVDWYSDADFHAVHMRSGPWVVIPDGPAPASPPEPTEWWK